MIKDLPYGQTQYEQEDMPPLPPVDDTEYWEDSWAKPTMIAYAKQYAAQQVAKEREMCARVAEGGSFLHNEAPDAKFGKACAEAIRNRGKSTQP